MAATANIKMWSEVLGLGDTKRIAANFTDGSTPTAGGQSYQTVTTSAVQVNIGSSAATTLRQVIIVAESGIIWASAVGSAAITTSCCISAGNCLVFSYNALTAIPWVQATSTAAKIDSLWYTV